MKKLLIANRGEISLRIIKTAHRLGIETVVLCTEPEKNSQPAKHATEVIVIGSGPSKDSYLNIEKVIEAALKTNSDAIHPGYGFLSENVELVKEAQRNSIEFVGPSIESMEKMGSKSISKRIMIDNKVPVINGYQDENQDPDYLFEKAKEIGFPVMIKACLGGGGKGMRLCLKESDFFDMLNSAKAEARTAFNDDKVIIEKFISDPKHIEVQIVADKYGNTFHFFERDCSIQRRHQKIIEEAPSNLPVEVIRKIREVSVRAAKAVNYVNAGTVEFLYDKDTSDFYFMEMNTRLQVEHPVSEMISGVDLVELQLKVAQGINLSGLKINDSPKGHAIEARICAEDPFNGFLPSSGNVKYFNFNNKRITDTSLDLNTDPLFTRENVRFDSALVEGDPITQYYDSMIGKLIVWGEDRQIALSRLQKSLKTFQLLGLRTNVPFILNLFDDKEFMNYDYSLKYFDEKADTLLQEKRVDSTLSGTLAALVKLFPFDKISFGFRNNTTIKKIYRFEIRKSYTIDNKPIILTIEVRQAVRGKSVFDLIIIEGDNKKEVRVEFLSLSDKTYKFSIDNQIYEKEIVCLNQKLYSCYDCVFFEIEDQTDKPMVGDDEITHSNNIVAPMPGILTQMNCSVGDIIEEGKTLFAIEAMKMEHKVLSSRKIRILEINKQITEYVDMGSIVIKSEPVE